MSFVYEVEVMKRLPTRIYIKASSEAEAEATATLIGDKLDDDLFPYCEGQVEIEASFVAEVGGFEDDYVHDLKKEISVKDIDDCMHLIHEHADLLKKIYKEEE